MAASLRSHQVNALELRGVSYLYSHDPRRVGDMLQRVVTSLIMRGRSRDQARAQREVWARGISDVSLRLEAGNIYGLTGPNGAGKSTLFKLISGELRPQRGELYLCGVPITHEPRWRRAQLGLGYLSQQGTLINDLSVYLNLSLGAEAGARWAKRHGEPDASSFAERYRAALAHFQVEPLLSQTVRQLSGGERRRVELTRVLLQRPQVLILDEPFVALDASGIEETTQLLKIAQTWGAMVLLTDHQSAYIDSICDYKLSLSRGRLLSDPVSLSGHTIP